jgi:hypothetical protein
MKVDNGEVKWTYELDFKYEMEPMLIDYKTKSDQGHHSLATKDVSDGGFTLARLKIDTGNDKLIEIKQVKLT